MGLPSTEAQLKASLKGCCRPLRFFRCLAAISFYGLWCHNLLNVTVTVTSTKRDATIIRAPSRSCSRFWNLYFSTRIASFDLILWIVNVCVNSAYRVLFVNSQWIPMHVCIIITMARDLEKHILKYPGYLSKKWHEMFSLYNVQNARVMQQKKCTTNI